MKVYIYDISNWVRVQFENDKSGLGLRFLWNQVSNIPNDNLAIFVGDGYNCNARRRLIYPAYKMKRPKAADFVYEGIGAFKELLSFAKGNVGFVEVKGYEADDVIADISSKFKEVTIMSTDKDLMAIPNSMNPMCNQNWEKKEFVWTRKVLCGDPSDNIGGVRGFGETTWLHLEEWQKIVLGYFLQNPCEETLSDVEKINLPKRVFTALQNTSFDDIKSLGRVVGFFPVEEKYEISFGKNQPTKAEELLKEWFS